MVCIRCQMVVKAELEKLGLPYVYVKIGEADIIGNIQAGQLEQLKITCPKEARVTLSALFYTCGRCFLVCHIQHGLYGVKSPFIGGIKEACDDPGGIRNKLDIFSVYSNLHQFLFLLKVAAKV